MATEEELRRLREASEASAASARVLLDEDVKTVMAEVGRINELKPAATDQATYDKIMKVVQEATSRNESIATLKQNVETLGESAVSLFREMAEIARSLP